MNREPFFRREAVRDVREAQAWYRQVSLRIAADFVAEVNHAVELIAEHPLAFPVDN